MPIGLSPRAVCCWYTPAGTHVDPLLDLLTHPEAATFLRAIRAAPDDDTTRLVFADWLDEHGEPNWAQWIRTQCLAPSSDDEARQWAERWNDTFQRCFGALHAPQSTPTPGEMGVCRGFLEVAVCELSQWVPSGAALVRHPMAVVRGVRFTDSRPEHRDGTFNWYATDGNFPYGEYLPRELWDVLATDGSGTELPIDADVPVEALAYPTENAALHDLAHWGLRYAWHFAPDHATPPDAPADSAHGFHQLLDANPAEHGLRLTFAQWLAARWDPRAEGFRALALARRAPTRRGGQWVWDWNRFPAWERQLRLPARDPDDLDASGMTRHCLPQQWFDELSTNAFGSRREAEWAAVRAWFVMDRSTRTAVLTAAGHTHS